MKFDCSNKFDLCYYGQVNSLLLKSSVASKWTSKYFLGSNIYFAGDGTSGAFERWRLVRILSLKDLVFMHALIAFDIVGCQRLAKAL